MINPKMSKKELCTHLEAAMQRINVMVVGSQDGYIISYSTNPDDLAHAQASARLTAWGGARSRLIEELPFLADVPEVRGQYWKEYAVKMGVKD